MQTQVDIQEIIRRLMAGQPVDNWTLNSYAEMVPSGTGVGADAETKPSGNQIPVGAVWDGAGAGYSDAYGMDGNHVRRTADVTDSDMFKSYLGDFLKIGGAMSGLSGFGEALSGGSFLQGAAQPFNSVFGTSFGAPNLADLGGEALASSPGGGGFDSLIKGFSALPEVAAPGAALGATAAPLELADLGVGSALTSMAAAPSFMDKLGTFASDPMNLLKTVGTVGGLYEALKGGNEGDFTQTSTKTLDPRIDSALFGADGKGGLLGQAQAWAAANPTGQNQTMRDAQSGLRGLLTDPRVMQGYMTQGGTGMGLMGRGVATNPWLTPKVGG